ncbi:MAG TPA: ImmA/IrrE family metallo-endopeptidase [Gemmatimonadaceae bacterium]|jgi:Zn-dependent peptidase ImmA (M78 family)
MTVTAEKQAMQTLRRLGIDDTPIPVHLVAQRLGLHVQSFALGDDVSGVLVIEGDTGVIGYNSSHPSVRQRFTIAHEIGHYVLHREDASLFIDERYFTAFRDKKSSQGSDPRERQANAFAAALLMPTHLVKREIEQQRFDIADDETLGNLAKKFEVSVQSMAYRLSNLSLFALTA